MDKHQLIECHERIKPYIHNTPVLTSHLIDQMVGASVFFKCENFQKMGAFKMRGAANAIMQLPKALQQKGVVTHSSGNFAQALSLAAQGLGVKAFIVMPKNAPQVKKNAVKGYGGIVIECDPTLEARERQARMIEEEHGATFIHPSNDDNVILGQGTACKELLEVYPNLDYVVAPVGGGGLIAGTALAAHYFGNPCQVIGGEPLEVDDAYRSLQSGTIETNSTTNTIADGLKTHLGDRNFPIIQNYVSQIIRVTEDEIIEAMRMIWERLKIVCEPSSAVALAAIFSKKLQFKGKKIGVIVSGGNVDVNNLPF
ncbi:threonine/serine dehydratase [Flagellimonas alvinocaridis]|uniref:Threonine/serine dehydratase n=1 Tax=Flagellimonas alvinocaridis TaxID=2530200 RepID=A0A4V6T779_9FLAO|nr:threonine/serine dehydratase [Allomuricauda alvinocaridis]THV58806.1 threonine/serine dehydratase [Allomuricauda alvinocaridis]